MESIDDTQEMVCVDDIKPEHKVFILEYIRTGNAVKSYQSVYPKSTSYSAAAVNAHKLLRNAKISNIIRQYYDKLWKDRKEEIGRSLDSLFRIARSDIADILEYKKGKLELRDINSIDSTVIQQITQTVTDTKEGKRIVTTVKLHDKTKAISELIDILGMNEDPGEMQKIVIIPAKRPERPNRINNEQRESVIVGNQNES